MSVGGFHQAVKRPALRYHGGKWKLAKWIIEHFPPHRIYCEPFGGGASVLLQKPRSYAEIYNDKDGEVVNLFQVIRDNGEALKLAIESTPYARDEFALSYESADSPLEQARRMIVRAFMGFGSAAASGQKTGFRAMCRKTNSHPATDWDNYPKCMDALMARLRGVVIENREAIAVMVQQDAPDTLHYLDPPYVMGTRSESSQSGCYKYEMTDEQHLEFLEVAKQLKGKVIISGYACELYDTHLKGWRRVERRALADGARERVEVLWMNYDYSQPTLFG